MRIVPRERTQSEKHAKTLTSVMGVLFIVNERSRGKALANELICAVLVKRFDEMSSVVNNGNLVTTSFAVLNPGIRNVCVI